MLGKIYLLLLILCCTLCQGITVTSSDDDTQKSSDLLVREKRVVNLEQPGHIVTPIDDANYLVHIKDAHRTNCVGAILSHYTVITAAVCLTLENSKYQIVSGSGYAHQGSNHSISSKLTNYGNPPHDNFDGIALITVEPHFVFALKTGSINLYQGPLPTGKEVTVSGWGSCYPLLPPSRLQRRLRQINVPIMDHRECANTYQRHLMITYKHICTYHEKQYCARTDIGAPLVVDHMLAGIHVVKPEIMNQVNPDVFINLQLPEYHGWISRNIRYI